jgi:NhaP-type Na+/H+ and K+/H+ antiporter
VRELKLPPESLVAIVIRDGQPIFPTGGTTLKAGDEILAFTRTAHEEELRRLFFARAAPSARSG